MSGAETPWVLDTSAFFCLRDNEEGAEQVARILAGGDKRKVYVSFATLMEYFYIVYQELGREEAYKAYLELKMLPIEFVESQESITLLAGEIKASFSLSFADACIAATAEHLGAELVHKDPEFEPLAKRLTLKTLPYKSKRS